VKAAAKSSTDAPPYVDAIIVYSERAADGGTIFANGKYTFKMENHPMRVYNARLGDVSFEKNGFTLVKSKTNVDLTDQTAAAKYYYPEVEQLVKKLTGAKDVIAFMGILRGGEQNAGGGPALSAHVDFTEYGLRSSVARFAPDRSKGLESKRLVNINVWRPLKTVERSPLAVCDKSSVDRSDFLRINFGTSTQTGAVQEPGGFNCAYNPKHAWYYYPHMEPDEVLVFKLFDTGEKDCKMTAHTAFDDPTSAPNAPPRISYEIRTCAVFD
jgi:hypothetical protein